MRCWGLNDEGQLGYGHANDVGDNPGEMPPQSLNLSGTVTQIVSGMSHNCVLHQSGMVSCWGRNKEGELGVGFASVDNFGDEPGEGPTTAGYVQLGGLAVQLAAGAYHTCALMDTGDVRCWGYAAFGQLGYGDSATAVTLPLITGDVPLF